ncbi:hypothetical protein MHYP_G00139860 [Metynnis hypsauchen]
MSKTFSSRRLEVVSSSPAVQDVKERWPALFSEAQIKEEFRRITTIRLEETFMSKLDGYTPRLLELMRAKGGVAGTKLRPILDAIKQSHGIERKRDMVIQSLIEYLGESREELFHDCQDMEPFGTSSPWRVQIAAHAQGEWIGRPNEACLPPFEHGGLSGCWSASSNEVAFPPLAGICGPPLKRTLSPLHPFNLPSPWVLWASVS